MTFWHKFLVCFTWAASGYIWETTFFFLNFMAFSRGIVIVLAINVCASSITGHLALSVSLMCWHLYWGTQSGWCYCHIQGNLACPAPHHWCQVPCGCRCRCIQEATVIGTTSRGTTRWSGAVGSVASAMGLGSATLPLLFPWFHRLYVKNPLTFTCTNLCMSGVLMCWVEKNLVMHDVIYKSKIDGERQRECLLTP